MKMYNEEKRAEMLMMYEAKLLEKECVLLEQEKYSDAWYKQKKEVDEWKLGMQVIRKSIENKYFIERENVPRIWSNDLEEMEKHIEQFPKDKIRISRYYQ